MKIRELYLKNFGKFSEKKVELTDGINLFYGENESGKTTIHTFIKSMLFGLERGRGRASANDTFSLYEPWENPNYYSGVLRFESGEKNFCITRNFDKYGKSASFICEDDGEEFSLEHGDLEMILHGLSASNYENTIAIGQMKIETDQSLAAELQNYATNYYATGNSDIDLDGALTRLNKKKKDVEKEIQGILQKKQQKRYEIEQEKSFVWRDIHKLEQESEELEEKIDAQKGTHEELEAQEVKKWRVHPIEFVGILIAFVILFFVLEYPWNFLIIIVLALAEGILVWNRIKDGGKKPQEEVLREVQLSLSKLLWQKEHIQGELKEKQTMYSNLEEQLNELEETGEDYKSQEHTKKALELAIQKLLELSKDVHQELSMKLNERASSILAEITGGKYEMLFVDEKLKMSLYTAGKRVPIQQVSRGTIEQIYFALRMAASEILYEEEYPVILDDTFVFYDDNRLENTMRWLMENKKQVIIFTCQKREQEILNKIRE